MNVFKSEFVEMFGENPVESGKWKVETLPELCTTPITDGTHQTPTYTTAEDGVPFISSKDVTSKKIDWSNIKYITSELHEKLYKRIAPQKNDILLAKNGTTGVAALVEDNRVFDIYVTLALIRPDLSKVNPNYLLQVINSDSCKNQFDSHLIGIGVPNLHLRDINCTKIPVPPLDLQNKFAAFVQQIDKSKFVLQQQLQFIKKYAIIFKKIKMSSLTEKLLEKSKEAFVLAIEIYNKPTIRYRVEGFAFFICNAWELMLKAHIINKFGESEIYYKDNPERTKTLENCIKIVFTNDKDPLRMNLEKIIELRNTSTHFITEEYEMVYVPLFQSCIFNFSEKMLQFHDFDVTKLISLNFLNLVVKEKALDENEVRAKYSEQIADKLLSLNTKIYKISSESNSTFSIRIEHDFYITKDKTKATDSVFIDKNATTGIKIVKELKDPNETHRYTSKKVCIEVAKRIERENLNVLYKGEKLRTFNMYHLGLFSKYYKIKDNPKWCYVYKVNTTPTYSYSQQAIDFIIEEIKKDPENILDKLKEKGQKKS